MHSPRLPLLSFKNEEIEEKVFQELQRLNYKISFAESCTGGMLVSKLINVSGTSAVIEKSFVTYSEDAKMEILNVSRKTLDDFGVVSKETVTEMVNMISITRAYETNQKIMQTYDGSLEIAVNQLGKLQ